MHREVKMFEQVHAQQDVEVFWLKLKPGDIQLRPCNEPDITLCD